MKLHLQIWLGILASMNELDQAWSEMLADAAANARSSGRADVAEYLALRQSNDAIRQTGVEWLFNAFIEIASEVARDYSQVVIEREDPHEFEFNRSRMAGSLVRVRFGVRRMTIEAGWTRTPEHGFMRGGALAAARIKHFGRPKAEVELTLWHKGEAPGWQSLPGVNFDSMSLREHFAILLEN